ncbi:hypothetical protein [Cytobacillus horneckiae]|uniref:hypothetical protein n=1 Tax=Cytobacillus horneckiae TaxID=549687 RepID=UPI0008256382|nr:hypothetical protein [Cytobacillus horneckiae]MEC1153942.1 carboxymuconolactone decarboxylase family protein [Cytobacillus horneckiae]MED2938517.1 carboxymuconolactone decarboxylase family protein [Cytobacillus horneckiae]
MSTVSRCDECICYQWKAAKIPGQPSTNHGNPRNGCGCSITYPKARFALQALEECTAGGALSQEEK